MAFKDLVNETKKINFYQTHSRTAQTPKPNMIEKDGILEATESDSATSGRSTSINAIVKEIEAEKAKNTSKEKSWENCKARKHAENGKDYCRKFICLCSKEKCNPRMME